MELGPQECTCIHTGRVVYGGTYFFMSMVMDLARSVDMTLLSIIFVVIKSAVLVVSSLG